MSDTQFYLSLFAVLIFFLGLVAYIVKGNIDRKRSPKKYNWKPEQDYDVVHQGETPITPGFPVLKKRKKPGPVGQQAKGSDSSDRT